MRYLIPLLAGLLPTTLVQADIYKCVGEGGHVTLSNVQARKCSRLVPSPAASADAAAAGSATPGAAPASPPAGRQPTTSGAKAASTPGFPRVDASTQRVRDDERRRILDGELASERRSLEEARQALAQGESSRPANEVQGLKDKVALHERNLEALRKEIGNLR
jgi:hypothetical protein